MELNPKKTAVIFKAFCDENRIKILQLLIDGEKYCIGKYDGEGSVLPMISLSDGVMRDFDMSTSQFEEKDGFRTNLKQTEDEFIRIDGVLYNTPVSYTNVDGTHMMVLYHEGKPQE